MTCIVALRAEGRVYMGADSCSASGYEARELAIPKMQRSGKYILAITGYLRALQVIAYGCQLPEPKLCRSQAAADKHMYALANCIRDAMIEEKYADIEHSKAEYDSWAMLAWGAHCYLVQGNFQFIEHRGEYEAMGSGSDYALGSLHSSGKLKPRQRIRQALAAAAYFQPGCVKPPFRILVTEPA